MQVPPPPGISLRRGGCRHQQQRGGGGWASAFRRTAADLRARPVFTACGCSRAEARRRRRPLRAALRVDGESGTYPGGPGATACARCPWRFAAPAWLRTLSSTCAQAVADSELRDGVLQPLAPTAGTAGQLRDAVSRLAEERHHQRSLIAAAGNKRELATAAVALGDRQSHLRASPYRPLDHCPGCAKRRARGICCPASSRCLFPARGGEHRLCLGRGSGSSRSS